MSVKRTKRGYQVDWHAGQRGGYAVTNPIPSHAADRAAFWWKFAGVCFVISGVSYAIAFLAMIGWLVFG